MVNDRSMRNRCILSVLVALTVAAGVIIASAPVIAQKRRTPAPPVRTGKAHSPPPFGANIFQGNFTRQVADGRTANYRIMPGDRVVVNTWGTLEIAKVFVVDGQGNVFIPSIGPVRLGGVRNSNLTSTVKKSISRVYRKGFGVYTNLLTAAPVTVFVTGGVTRPGRYAGVPSDSVLFFLDQAGGIHAGLGSYRDVRVLRGGKEISKLDLYDFALNGKLPAVQLTKGDVILVGRRGPVVEVRGKVPSPAAVELSKQRFTGIEVMRVLPRSARATTVAIRGVRNGRPFHQTMTAAEFVKAQLRDGDRVEFRDDALPDTILISLSGEFKGPSLLSVKRGARLVDVLNFVAVNPKLSDVRSIHLKRRSVAAAQKSSIQRALYRLERSAMLALSSTDREAAIRVKEAELMQAFVKSARTIQPLGRVVTSSRGRQINLLLRDGDTVVIPPRTNVVRVSGEVQMSQAVMHRPNTRVKDYIKMAGGYTRRSDKTKILIIHASAAVTMASPASRVHPGDELMVMPRIDKKTLQNAADVVQVIYQVAVAAAVVLAI